MKNVKNVKSSDSVNSTNRTKESKMAPKVVNWKLILGVVGTDNLMAFAGGYLSGRDLYSLTSGTEAGGEVRNALRSRGVETLRKLARNRLRSAA